jgi:hypothetical protein
MATLDINSKLRMNSGYEIPVLGYGVSFSSRSCLMTEWYVDRRLRFIKRKTKSYEFVRVELVGADWFKGQRVNAKLL